jgi:ubiquinone/menaquinone biosynthesis C-methylase UbiE
MTQTLSKRKLWLMEKALGGKREAIERPFAHIDWTKEAARYENPGFDYPEYYRQNFHGVAGGYLNSGAAVTYDPVTARIVMPNEMKIRRAFVDHVRTTLAHHEPQRILDLGIGTGQAALLWSQTYQHSRITGIDLSPYMLIAAEMKLQGKNVELLQANAEHTNFEAGSFDMVTASFLFHELPKSVAPGVVAEALRLLRPGGIFAMWDGNQKGNLLVKTVGGYFPEPYLREYVSYDIGETCRRAGFVGVSVRRYLQLYQFVTAFKF